MQLSSPQLYNSFSNQLSIASIGRTHPAAPFPTKQQIISSNISPSPQWLLYHNNGLNSSPLNNKPKINIHNPIAIVQKPEETSPPTKKFEPLNNIPQTRQSMPSDRPGVIVAMINARHDNYSINVPSELRQSQNDQTIDQLRLQYSSNEENINSNRELEQQNEEQPTYYQPNRPKTPPVQLQMAEVAEKQANELIIRAQSRTGTPQNSPPHSQPADHSPASARESRQYSDRERRISPEKLNKSVRYVSQPPRNFHSSSFEPTYINSNLQQNEKIEGIPSLGLPSTTQSSVMTAPVSLSQTQSFQYSSNLNKNSRSQTQPPQNFIPSQGHQFNLNSSLNQSQFNQSYSQSSLYNNNQYQQQKQNLIVNSGSRYNNTNSNTLQQQMDLRYQIHKTSPSQHSSYNDTPSVEPLSLTQSLTQRSSMDMFASTQQSYTQQRTRQISGYIDNSRPLRTSVNLAQSQASSFGSTLNNLFSTSQQGKNKTQQLNSGNQQGMIVAPGKVRISVQSDPDSTPSVIPPNFGFMSSSPTKIQQSSQNEQQQQKSPVNQNKYQQPSQQTGPANLRQSDNSYSQLPQYRSNQSQYGSKKPEQHNSVPRPSSSQQQDTPSTTLPFTKASLQDNLLNTTQSSYNDIGSETGRYSLQYPQFSAQSYSFSQTLQSRIMPQPLVSPNAQKSGMERKVPPRRIYNSAQGQRAQEQIQQQKLQLQQLQTVQFKGQEYQLQRSSTIPPSQIQFSRPQANSPQKLIPQQTIQQSSFSSYSQSTQSLSTPKAQPVSGFAAAPAASPAQPMVAPPSSITQEKRIQHASSDSNNNSSARDRPTHSSYQLEQTQTQDDIPTSNKPILTSQSSSSSNLTSALRTPSKSSLVQQSQTQLQSSSSYTSQSIQITVNSSKSLSPLIPQPTGVTFISTPAAPPSAPGSLKPPRSDIDRPPRPLQNENESQQDAPQIPTILQTKGLAPTSSSNSQLNTSQDVANESKQ